MTYVIPAGYSRVNLEYAPISVLGSRPAWGFGLNRAPSDELVNEIYDAWSDILQPFTSNGYILERVSARSDVGFAELEVSAQGAVSSPAASPNTALLMKLATGQAGRTNRGRIYPVGILTDNSVNDDGTLDTSAREDLQAAMDSFFQAIETVSEAELYVLHSTSSDPTLVTSATVQASAATQRRRLRR